MALVQCTECGNQVSTTAAACPKCGAPPRTEQQISIGDAEIEEMRRKTQQELLAAVVTQQRLHDAEISRLSDENMGCFAAVIVILRAAHNRNELISVLRILAQDRPGKIHDRIMQMVNAADDSASDIRTHLKLVWSNDEPKGST